MKASFYETCILSAEAGKAVWLGDLRASGASAPGAERLVLRLTDCGGVREDFPLFLPPWQGEGERDFARSILSACVFNLLSACSGNALRLYMDPDDLELRGLAGELRGIFQLDNVFSGLQWNDDWFAVA